MANGLQRAAQAPPPAELDDVFVIAITALSTAAPDVLRCGISNRRVSAWGQKPKLPSLDLDQARDVGGLVLRQGMPDHQEPPRPPQDR
jgi:hypothetical protein